MSDESKVALLSIRNHALAAKKLPGQLTLLKWGRNKTDRGDFIVNERTVACIAKQREGGIHDRPLIDFEHNSIETSPTYQKPPRHHAGVGAVFCSPERGLGMEDIEWTPKGEEYARNYPDISPALKYDAKTREVVGLQSTGLVPAGGIIGLSFFAAEDPAEYESTNQETENMDIKEIIKGLFEAPEFVDGLKAALKDMLPKPEEKPAADAPKAEEVTAMAAKVEQGETALATLKADMEAGFAKRDKDALLQQAAFAGKVVQLDDDAIATLSVEALKAHIDKLQVTVPLESRTALFTAKPDGGEGQTLIEQFNAIKDPAERAKFYREHRKDLTGVAD